MSVYNSSISDKYSMDMSMNLLKLKEVVGKGTSSMSSSKYPSCVQNRVKMSQSIAQVDKQQWDHHGQLYPISKYVGISMVIRDYDKWAKITRMYLLAKSLLYGSVTSKYKITLLKFKVVNERNVNLFKMNGCFDSGSIYRRAKPNKVHMTLLHRFAYFIIVCNY